MKILSPLLLLILMITTSCGSNQSKDSKEATDESEISAKDNSDVPEFKEAKNCDEFIDQYEKWMDNYLVLLEKYMKNPMDQTLAQEYATLGQEVSSWSNQWVNKFAMCAANEKYKKRFDEISEKVEKKMKELGLN